MSKKFEKEVTVVHKLGGGNSRFLLYESFIAFSPHKYEFIF